MLDLNTRYPKEHRTGTHRSRTPAETLTDFGTRMERIGITRLANMTGLDWIGIPVYNAIRPNSRSLSVSQGKGVDHDAAKVSAMMESIEYWHAEVFDGPLRHDSYRELSVREPVIDVHQLPLRGGLDTIGAARQTPARAQLRTDLPTLWARGYDLLRQSPMWVPHETVRLNKVGLDYAATTFRVGSNGLASGNSLPEAIVHGICELAERDALTMWWNGLQDRDHVEATKLGLDTVTDPVCTGLLEQFDAAGIDVVAWDVTCDTEIPAYQVCVAEREQRASWRSFGACWGYGAHTSPAVALSRALTEAAQSRVTVIAASRDENFRTMYHAQNDAETLRRTREAFFSQAGTHRFDSTRGVDNPTVNEDLDDLLTRLRNAGIDQVVAVDLTRPDIGIPTAKVIIPGLEYYSLFVGYAPGPRARRRQPRPSEAIS
ncbi:ribosomal protein S12 methylthiotransferase accessory factor [Amycolatopsis pretoriensis]|uniref:Ribosomal protein S12 methylthiotransferase accessory factor n=1 Tax=Amycolatopsis pretoriensis TaxID=218821 RepID=A0A1H5QBF5_9PSEU|nr:YcaO-like family protein [Amycolatopsis pretoriensis]SEF23483.1 ribosomal protein S12 methylthiotransferase accessory factor [Amycolatopsis pretoriensis]